MRERALAALDFVGMRAFAGRSGTALSFGQQRVIEIARALIGDPRVVLLDEPAVGLSPPRVAELDILLRRIRDERGITLVMIEHVIRLVMEYASAPSIRTVRARGPAAGERLMPTKASAARARSRISVSSRFMDGVRSAAPMRPVCPRR